MTIDPTTLRAYFQKFLENGGYCTPPGRAACALDNARAVLEFRTTPGVRLRREPEREDYFSVYGDGDAESRKFVQKTIDQWGLYWVVSEFRAPNGEWMYADSIGMCIYENPLDPFQNCYVPELMRAAIEKRNEAWEGVPA